MTHVLAMLCAFTALGLVSRRLDRRTSYTLMGLVILVYVSYAYVTG